jgi:hypothetical protein
MKFQNLNAWFSKGSLQLNEFLKIIPIMFGHNIFWYAMDNIEKKNYNFKNI